MEAGSFEGPLDLMLHLVRQHKLDLQNLDLAELARQYILYIGRMKELHLEVASEYLVELATMVETKSRLLLPRQKEDEEEDTFEEDRRDDLVRRLLEYQAYKEAAQDMKDRYEARSLQFTRDPSELVETWQKRTEGKLEKQELSELLKAMRRVIRRQAILQPHPTRLQTKELSTEQRRIQLEEKFAQSGKLSFDYLCADCTSRHMVIVTFLAVLDLLHDDWLKADVEDGRILLERRATQWMN